MAYMLKTVTFIVIPERNHDILTLICELFVGFEKCFGSLSRSLRKSDPKTGIAPTVGIPTKFV